MRSYALLAVFAASVTARPSTTEVESRQTELASWPAMGGSLALGTIGSTLGFSVFAPQNYVDGAPSFAASFGAFSYAANIYTDCKGFIDGNGTVEATAAWNGGFPPQPTTITVRHTFTTAAGKAVIASGTYSTTNSNIAQFHISVGSVN
ncbi:hypothetical protein GGR51DRAFT_542204 [Nemania sp. FL0031]|nr:hypothetical protein GGR51DRAFT_542204 [Nemania sp. FL0031]